MNAMNADWRQVEELFETLVEKKSGPGRRGSPGNPPTEETIAQALALIGARRGQIGAQTSGLGASQPAGRGAGRAADKPEPRQTQSVAQSEAKAPKTDNGTGSRQPPARAEQTASAAPVGSDLQTASDPLTEKVMAATTAEIEAALEMLRRFRAEANHTVAAAAALQAVAATAGPARKRVPDEKPVKDAAQRLAKMPQAEELPAVLDIEALEAGIRAEVAEAVAEQADMPARPRADYGSLPLGSMVGPFRVKSLIARGALGEAYSARRADGAGDAKVVLRLLRGETAARFDRLREDRRSVAGLVHPAIARMVADGVAADGRPFIATEFVEGEDLLAYCRRRKPNLKARLKLMLQLCDAVAFAHQRLALHQDIYPGNIRVSDKDQPKLVDFALARFARAPEEMRAPSRSMQCYAAPERLKGAPASMATDIYGLGAVFFELMTGISPWQPDDTALSFASRKLNNEPPLASAVRIKDRSLPPVPAKRLSGDLDAIIAKALRYQPEDRYATVDALAGDIRRHLANEPVVARNGGMLYRLHRSLRRNRAAMSVAGLVAAISLGIGGFGVYELVRTELQRRADGIQAEKTAMASDLMLLVFRAAAASEAPGFGSVRQVLDRTTVQLDAGEGTRSRPQDLLLALGQTYVGLEEFDGASYVLGEFSANARERGDVTGANRADLLRAEAAIANLDFDGAASLLDGVEPYFRAAPALYGPELTRLSGTRARLLAETGKRDEAVALLTTTLAALEKTPLEHAAAAADLWQKLGAIQMKRGKLDEAGASLERAGALYGGNGLAEAPAALAVEAQQALLAFSLGDWPAAREAWQETIARRRALYGPSDALAAVELSFGRALLSKGETMEAMLRLDDGLTMVSGEAGNRGAIRAMLLQSRGLANLGLGNLRRAQQDLAEAVALSEEVFGTDSLYYGMAMMAHAEMSYRSGDLASAREDAAAADQVFAAIGDGARDQIDALSRLRRLLEAAAL